MSRYNFPINVVNMHHSVVLHLGHVNRDYHIIVPRDKPVFYNVNYKWCESFPLDDQGARLNAAYEKLEPLIKQYFAGEISLDIVSRAAQSC